MRDSPATPLTSLQEAVRLAVDDFEEAVQAARAARDHALSVFETQAFVHRQQMQSLRGAAFPWGICPICLGEDTPCFAIAGSQQVACWMPSQVINPPLYIEATEKGQLLFVYDFPGVYPGEDAL